MTVLRGLLAVLLFVSTAGRWLVIAGVRTAGRADLVATVGGCFVHHIHIQHHMHTLITADQQVRGRGRRRWVEVIEGSSRVNFRGMISSVG